MLVTVYDHKDVQVHQEELNYKNEDTFLTALDKNEKLGHLKSYLNSKKHCLVLEGEHVMDGKGSYTIALQPNVFLGKWNNLPEDDPTREEGVLETMGVLEEHSRVSVNFDYIGSGFDYQACVAFVDKARSMGYTEFTVYKPSRYGIDLSLSKFN